MISGRFMTVATKPCFFFGFWFKTFSQYQKPSTLYSGCSLIPASLQFSTTAFLQFQPESATAKDLKGFYGNPLMEMQPYLEIPIIPDEDLCFNPLIQEMKMAEELFTSYKKNQINFLKSAAKSEDLPETNLHEIAFMGRSNVGKSSLINALFHQCPDVKVRISSKPGHTKTLNFFQVKNHFFLIDMPGYGYNMPQHFVDSVETYLRSRRMLCRTFLLLDCKVGVTSADKIALEMFEEFQIPYVLVFTKIDKVNNHIQLRNFLSVLKIKDQLSHCCFTQPFLVSSKTSKGIPLLQTFIGYVTGNLKIKGH